LIRWKGWYIGIVAQYVQNVQNQHSIISIQNFSSFFRGKNVKETKLGLLSFHEENTRGIQTQATKILQLTNG
jgi:hypothetical protein